MPEPSYAIELIRVDSNEIQSVPDATNAMERAITREKADFVIGGFRSEAVLAMQDVAMDYKKIFLGCGAADAKLGANVERLGVGAVHRVAGAKEASVQILDVATHGTTLRHRGRSGMACLDHGRSPEGRSHRNRAGMRR